MTLPKIFFNPKQAGRWPITAAKKKTEDKKERGKKKFKSRKA